MKKRIWNLIIILVLCTGLLAGCSNNETINKDKKFSVVTTIFPEYDWVRELLGKHAGNYDLTLLLDKGVDLHSYQPNTADIAKIAGCDMFIYVGGESDEWVKDALAEATNKDMIVINLLDVLGDAIKEEEVVEGMESEEEIAEESESSNNTSIEENGSVEEVNDDVAEESSSIEEIEYDEHVWLSLKNAIIICNKISESLSSIDRENANSYRSNCEKYIEKLTALDKEYKKAVDSSTVKTILFGDRFPFRYMVDDYGLNYSAAFVGCSAETEASYETIVFLANKIDELGLSTVLTIENSDQSIAKTIIENTTTKDQTVLVMNSLQSVTSNDITNGVTYYSIMSDNLKTLKQALQ